MIHVWNVLNMSECVNPQMYQKLNKSSIYATRIEDYVDGKKCGSG